jgi:hypothetical protein
LRIRVRRALLKRLEAAAKQNKRPLTTEIVDRLEGTLDIDALDGMEAKVSSMLTNIELRHQETVERMRRETADAKAEFDSLVTKAKQERENLRKSK